MSGVDVLAVMKVDAIAAEEWRFMQAGDAAAFAACQTSNEARATVAELIERERVMREALEDLRQQCRNNLEVGALGPAYWTDAQETIDAALARVQGGAK